MISKRLMSTFAILIMITTVSGCSVKQIGEVLYDTAANWYDSSADWCEQSYDCDTPDNN